MNAFICAGVVCLVSALALYLKYRGDTNDGDMFIGIIFYVLLAGGGISLALAAVISALF